jgi:hypothetical protein
MKRKLVASIAVFALLACVGPDTALAQAASHGALGDQVVASAQLPSPNAVTIPTCWTCGDPSFGAQNQCIRLGAGGPGAASCTPNVYGDWCVLEGDCEGNVPAAEMPADGANLKLPQSPDANAAAMQAGVSLATVTVSVSPGVVMTRSCGGVVVARAYAPRVGAVLRGQTRLISL